MKTRALFLLASLTFTLALPGFAGCKEEPTRWDNAA
jgi:hypothetical protein